MKPFWAYYGGKWRAAPRYPKPLYETIIEPFAGAGGYSLRYHKHKVILVEKYPVVAEIWKYLINVTPSEVMSLPLVDAVDDLPSWTPQGAKYLIGFCLNAATVSPCKTLSSGAKFLRSTGRTIVGWSKERRQRVAEQVNHIKHWSIIDGDYRDAPNIEATWFIDPPYNNKAGKCYVHSDIHYRLLGDWCKSRNGQVIVCENEGADWLPFRPFATLKAGVNGFGSKEVIHYQLRRSDQMPTKQEVALFEMPVLPKEYQAFLETETNITPRETTPTLNPGGKRWTVAIDGESVVLKKPDPENDGETVPLQIFKGFVVAHSPKRGRTYYETGFDDKKPGRPTCWSEDSVTPDPRVPAADRQHKVCNGCSQAAKGSAVSDDGRETKACKEHQLIAILPTNRIDGDFPALRLKLSITSIFDGKDPPHEEQGWYAWGPYLQHLMARMPQNAHTARVETMICFDSTVQYPKLLFKPKRGVTAEEYIKLVDFMRANKDRLATMVDALMPQGAPLPPKANVGDEENETPAHKKTPAAEEDEPPKKPSPKPTRKAVSEEEDAPPKPKPTRKAVSEEEDAPPPKPKPKLVVSEEEDDPPPKPKPAKAVSEEDDPPPKPKPAKAVSADDDAEVPPGMRKKNPIDPDEIVSPKPKPKGNIKDLLSEWA